MNEAIHFIISSYYYHLSVTRIFQFFGILQNELEEQTELCEHEK